jgi:hypothetical protein
MAIDSAAKRKTISGIPFAYSPGVTSDVSEGQDWRFSAAGSYIGFVSHRLDTAEKRRAAAGMPCSPMGPGVTPNSAKDLQWRREVAWGYLFGSILRSNRSVYRTERSSTYKTARAKTYQTE